MAAPDFSKSSRHDKKIEPSALPLPSPGERRLRQLSLAATLALSSSPHPSGRLGVAFRGKSPMLPDRRTRSRRQSEIQRFNTATQHSKGDRTMKNLIRVRVHVLALTASMLALPCTSWRDGAETLASAHGLQLASPGMPAPKLPKGPSATIMNEVASPGMPAPKLPKGPSATALSA